MKNRHGACRGTYLALSLGLIIGVTIVGGSFYGNVACASDALQPVNQRTGSSAPRFNPQAIFDVLGLKRIEYPRPGEQDLPDESVREADPPRDSSTLNDDGKKAHAALAIVSFQVAGEDSFDEDQDPELDGDVDQKLHRQQPDRRLARPVEATVSSIDPPDAVAELSLAPPESSDDSETEPRDERQASEVVETLTDDGSFDLTVSPAVDSGSEDPSLASPDTSERLPDSSDVVDEPTETDDDPTDIAHDIWTFDSGSPPDAEERWDNGAVDPWADPRLFEPADEPIVTNRSPNEPMDRQVDRLATPTSRPPVRPDTAITPIESSAPKPGRLPVADKVVTYQARTLIEDGMQLARRGAIYSARARFIRALRLITQAFDAQGGTRYYSESLARGFRAIEEVKDFRPKGSRLEADLDLQRIVQSHRTPVLYAADFQRLTTLVAQQSYHTYAENQLIEAAGQDPVAADALFALGKVQGHLSKQRGDSNTASDAEAMSLYQAALTVHPNHHHAANELGVLFARYGQLNDARAILRHCVRDRTNFPEVWRNLARVHEQLGEVELAKRASDEWRSAMRRSGRTANLAGRPSVEWVDPQTFARMSSPDDPSPQRDIAARQRPDRSSPAVSRSPKGSAMPSDEGQPLSVGQRYGR